MKKLFLSVFLVLACVLTAWAKDIITTKDGNNIEAKILEVSKWNVKYKKFSNLNGPVFTIPTSDILIIRYDDGEQEVFNYTGPLPGYVPNTTERVVRGMKYRQYKRFYNTKNYKSQPNDRYSVGSAGFASFIIPGLGQALVDEWGRGAAFFIGNVTLNAIMLNNISYDFDQKQYRYSENLGYLFAAALALNIYSVLDAIHVAKVKNMYYQDLYGQMASSGLKIEPYFAFTPSGANRMQPAAGLSLSLSF